MKVETHLPTDLRLVPAAARRAEALGYDAVVAAETGHDPFLPLALAAEHTARVGLVTSVAIAFPRAPMVVAQTAWDLQRLSGGRMVVGLGSQVRGHNERRYSTPWSAPGPRMRDYVRCLRAIWDCWQSGAAPDFHSDHYQFTLMTPFFNPGPLEVAPPKVAISAVNPYMARVAGEYCDGLRLHSFNTPRYTRQVLLPAVEEGLRRSGRPRRELELAGGGFIITGTTQGELERNLEGVRRQIAFYASTRVYRGVLEIHGWEGVGDRLYRLSVQGRWEEMPKLVTDEMVAEFAAVGTYDTIVRVIKEKYQGMSDAVELTLPTSSPDEEARVREMVAQLRAD